MIKSYLTIISIFIWGISFSQDHSVSFFGSAYLIQMDNFQDENLEQRIYSPGGSIELEHHVKDLKWIGSHLMIGMDEFNQIYLMFGIDTRFHFYDDFLRVDLHFPNFYHQFNSKLYVRQYGFGIHLGKKKIRLGVREMYFNKKLSSQIIIRYLIYKN